MGVVYLIALFSLILWEYRDRLDLISSACDVSDPIPRSALYSAPYKRLLDYATPESAPHVVVIAIPADLEDIQSNICLARSYIADLIRSIASQHPAEIVIDKFYSPSSCTTFPQNTADLLAVVRSLPFPVVVGESTNTAASMRDQSCLVRKPQLDFLAPNVHRGLTRLNIESEKIPLQWRVLPGDAPSAKAEPVDSLAWAAVKAYDPAFAQSPHLNHLLRTGSHPFAKLHIVLPRQTSTALLCSIGTAAMNKRWATVCSQPTIPLDLLGKVVVIGSEQEPDLRQVLGAPVWGFDLQARYIQALLSGSYLRAIPFWLNFVIFAAFVFAIEGLPTLLEVFRPGWRRNRLLAAAFRRRRYVWVIGWTFAFFLLLTIACIAVGYLPPLIVFGDIALVAITRLLFFAAETFETPLVQSHHQEPHP
jgi:hypothetical protein